MHGSCQLHQKLVAIGAMIAMVAIGNYEIN
jgi:hypothetical protein